MSSIDRGTAAVAWGAFGALVGLMLVLTLVGVWIVAVGPVGPWETAANGLWWAVTAGFAIAGWRDGTI